jgi:AcrR family transcriptional regulator
MSALDESSVSHDSADAAAPGLDGRTLRRERNIEAVRNATLELLAEGSHPSLGEIAERASVATRSVYRYFGDAGTAIDDALAYRSNRSMEVFRSEPAFSRSMPLDERVAMLILRRIRLEQLVFPLCCFPSMDPIRPYLDVEVREAFAPELEAAGGDEFLAKILCATFRLRSIHAMRETFDDSEKLTAGALSRVVSALLADAR